MKLQHAMTWKSAGFAAVAALFAACGQEAGADPAASADTVSAYAALSASVQACAEKKEACVTEAAGDATKLAACETAAESCLDKTQGAQADAKRRLCDDAEGCMRRHGRRGDDDAGVDESSRPGMHDCVRRSAPPQSNACTQELFACLDKTGLKESNAQTQLDQATKDAILACVQTAHTCIMNDMSAPRGRGPNGAAGAAPTRDRGGRDGDGDGRRGEAGRPSFPGAEAGRDGRHAAGAPAFPSDAGRSGAGRGQRDGRDAAGAPASGRGRRDGAGGAAGN